MTTEEEFDLSKRIVGEVYEGELDTSPSMEEEGFEGYFEVVRVKDVKEFIRRLKEEIGIDYYAGDILPREVIKIIDKLAGERLR